MYKEVLLDHYKRPRNEGTLDDADATAHGENEVCGDKITWYVNLRDSHITEAVFDGEGCAISQAATSMLSEHVQGVSVDDVLAMDRDYMMDVLETELTPLRVKCAMLGLKTLQDALDGDSI